MDKIRCFQNLPEERSKWCDASRGIVKQHHTGNPQPLRTAIVTSAHNEPLQLPECLDSEWESEWGDDDISTTSEEEYGDRRKVVSLAAALNKKLVQDGVDPAARLEGEDYDVAMFRRFPELLLPVKDLALVEQLKRKREEGYKTSSSTHSVCSLCSSSDESCSDDGTPYPAALRCTQQEAASWQAKNAGIADAYSTQCKLVEAFWMKMPGTPCPAPDLAFHHHNHYRTLKQQVVPCLASPFDAHFSSALHHLLPAGVTAHHLCNQQWDNTLLGRLSTFLNSAQIEVLRGYLTSTGISEWCVSASVEQLLGIEGRQLHDGFTKISGIELKFKPVNSDAWEWSKWLKEVQSRCTTGVCELEATFNHSIHTAGMWSRDRWDACFNAEQSVDHEWVVWDTLKCLGQRDGLSTYDFAATLSQQTDNGYTCKAKVWEVLACRTGNGTRLHPPHGARAQHPDTVCDTFKEAQHVYQQHCSYRENNSERNATPLERSLVASLYPKRTHTTTDTLQGRWKFLNATRMECPSCQNITCNGLAHGMARICDAGCPKCPNLLRPSVSIMRITGMDIHCSSMPPYIGEVMAGTLREVQGQNKWKARLVIDTREYIEYTMDVESTGGNTLKVQYTVSGMIGSYTFYLVRDPCVSLIEHPAQSPPRDTQPHWSCFPLDAKAMRFKALDDHELLTTTDPRWAPWPMMNPPVPPSEYLSMQCRVTGFVTKKPVKDEKVLEKIVALDAIRNAKVQRLEINCTRETIDTYFKFIARDRLRRMIWITGEVGGGRTTDIEKQRARHPFCTCGIIEVREWSNPTKSGEDPCWGVESQLQLDLFGQQQAGRNMNHLIGVSKHSWRSEWFTEEPRVLTYFRSRHFCNIMYKNIVRKFFGGLDGCMVTALLAVCGCVGVFWRVKDAPVVPSICTQYLYGDCASYLCIGDAVRLTSCGVRRVLLRRVHDAHPGQCAPPELHALAERALALGLFCLPCHSDVLSVAAVPGEQSGAVATVVFNNSRIDLWPGEAVKI